MLTILLLAIILVLSAKLYVKNDKIETLEDEIDRVIQRNIYLYEKIKRKENEK